MTLHQFGEQRVRVLGDEIDLALGDGVVVDLPGSDGWLVGHLEARGGERLAVDLGEQLTLREVGRADRDLAGATARSGVVRPSRRGVSRRSAWCPRRARGVADGRAIARRCTGWSVAGVAVVGGRRRRRTRRGPASRQQPTAAGVGVWMIGSRADLQGHGSSEDVSHRSGGGSGTFVLSARPHDRCGRVDERLLQHRRGLTRVAPRPARSRTPGDTIVRCSTANTTSTASTRPMTTIVAPYTMSKRRRAVAGVDVDAESCRGRRTRRRWRSRSPGSPPSGSRPASAAARWAPRPATATASR